MTAAAQPRPGTILVLLEEALASQETKLRSLAARAGGEGDGELVHDVRVSLRRLEALARLFRGLPEKEATDAVRASARALRRQLSLLRTEEVGRALLSARARGGRGGLAALVFGRSLPPVRVAKDEVASVGKAVSLWRTSLATTFETPSARRATTEEALLRRTRRRARRRLSELSKLLPPRRRTLHEARIAAKRARYALEVLAPLDPGIPPLLRLLRSFQDEAGDAHDLVELAARVRAAAVPGRPRTEALEALAVEIEADAGRAFASARRRGTILAGPVSSLGPALGRPDSR